MPNAPYKVRKSGDFYDVDIPGVGWLSHVDGAYEGHTNSSVSANDDKHANQIPSSNVTRMAQYLRVAGGADENSEGWLAGHHNAMPYRYGTIYAYVVHVGPDPDKLPSSVDPIGAASGDPSVEQSGLGDTVAGAKNISSMLDFFTSEAFWTRAGEVAIGLIILGVAIDKAIK